MLSSIYSVENAGEEEAAELMLLHVLESMTLVSIYMFFLLSYITFFKQYFCNFFLWFCFYTVP